MFGWFHRIEDKVNRALWMLERLTRQEEYMSQQLDDLTNEVATTATVEQSAIALINGLAGSGSV